MNGINTTLCYLKRGEEYLMLHRVKKEGDLNKDKWIGIGGKFEAGESPEDCLCREVLEETGLRVKNVRYFGSQPWGCAGNLTLGYWAELDGDDAVTLEERELAEARWFDRTEVPVMDDNTSLTSAMVRAFAEGKEREYHGG